MKRIEIKNITKNKIIVDNGYMANTFLTRLKGLLGKREIEDNEGICIYPCKSVHTFFMQFPIDIVFIDRDNKIIHITENLRHYRISKYVKNAEYVIEIGGSKSKKKDIEVGDEIDIIMK